MGYRDQGFFRRKFPRRAFNRGVGVLAAGGYRITEAGEIGEGGMSFMIEAPLETGIEIVVSFQIPGGSFVSLRAEVRSVRDIDGQHLHGISFKNAQFTHRRQIRSFVSSRGADESLIM